MNLRFLWRAYKARFRNEKTELRVIQHHLQPDSIVCDIGANKGSYLYWLSRWVPHGRVIAFEPQERLAAYLHTVCKSHNLTNVTIEAKAVHAKSGTMMLYVPGKGDSPGATLQASTYRDSDARSITVPVAALDDYFSPEEMVRVLKIDAEGAEMGVFQGAERILKQDKPLLLFECENRHLAGGSVHDVFHHLTSLGYNGQMILGEGLLPISVFDSSLHQNQTGNRFWEAKEYVNNFVFTPPR